GAERARAGAAGAVGRRGRPGRLQQHHDEGRAVLHPRGVPDQGLPRPPVRPHPPLRHPRARDGRDPQRHRAARRHAPVRRHLPGVLRLHAPVGAAGRADEAAGDVRVDARLHRPGRGRPDPPADRAPVVAARHPRPGRGPAGRRQRDRGRLEDGPGAHRPARGDRADPAERADPGGHQRRRGGARRLRAARRLRRPAPGPHRRHRQRGGDRARGPGAAGVAGHSGASRLDAVCRVVQGAGHRLQGDRPAVVDPGPGRGRGGNRSRLARVRRRVRRGREPRTLRRFRAVQDAVRAVRADGGARGRGGQGVPGQAGPGQGRDDGKLRDMSEILNKLSGQGVAIWLDDISRERLRTGNLEQLIREKNVVGVTSNPTIFANALGKGDAYNTQMHDLAVRGVDVGEAVRAITTYDIRWAADVLRPVYDATGGVDGRVSLEVDPRLAHDTDKTVAEARALWWLVDRPNLFIKVPATLAGLPAITQAIGEGISVNVTLIFSLERYRAVMDAWLAGLEAAQAKGLNLATIESVASFFVGPVDTEIDNRLDKLGKPELKG